MAGARRGMCELTRHGIAGERHGKGMDASWARHGMCELAFMGCCKHNSELLFSVVLRFLKIILLQAVSYQ
jgi:hypothetical protein